MSVILILGKFIKVIFWDSTRFDDIFVCFARLDVLLHNMKIAHYFDFVINSYDAGIEKPNIEIFKRAMKESDIEGLKPKECLHIGHSILPDYVGAQKAGW